MAKRLVEVFTSGCYLCDDVLKQVKDLACENCEVIVYDLNKGCTTNECELKAKEYGVTSVPAVAINGKLIDCCKSNGVNVDALKEAGLGQ
jgi:glutaredoxin